MSDTPLTIGARTLARITNGKDCYANLDPRLQATLKDTVTQVLVAIRRPSAAMMKAGGMVGGSRNGDLDAMLVWERMIDAAIAEG